jgi:hypothetical protein
MKLFLIIGGLFIVIFVCIIPLRRHIEEYNIQKNGELVTASITYVPHCIGSKIRYFMRFTYREQEFEKKVGCGFSTTHKVGDTIQLKHIDGSNIFLFETEKIEKEFASAAVLAVLGITFIVIGATRK